MLNKKYFFLVLSPSVTQIFAKKNYTCSRKGQAWESGIILQGSQMFSLDMEDYHMSFLSLHCPLGII